VKTWFAKHPGFQLHFNSHQFLVAQDGIGSTDSRAESPGQALQRSGAHARLNEDLDAHNDNPWQRPKVFTT
jgi:hypothetical protein